MTPQCEFLVARPAESSLHVHLSLPALDELGFEALTAFKSVPKRGLEIGGILLGGVDAARSTLTIESWEMVECEHRHGPSYMLSPADRSAILNAAAGRKNRNGSRVVGLFRSQTAAGEDLQNQDAALAREIFADRPSVVLRITPSVKKPSEGELAVRCGDSWTAPNRFPLRSSALRSGGFPIVSICAPAAAGAEALKLPDLRSLRAAAENIRRHIAVAPAAAALGLAGLVLAAGVHANSPAARSVEVALRVQHQNGSDILTWNGSSQPVHNAEYAVLRIADAGRSREVRLKRNQLGGGLLIYLPEGPDPKFRMQVYTPSAGR